MGKPATSALSAAATDKWEIQVRKGCLELAVLACLWDRPLYGLEVLRKLEADSDLIITEGTVYPLFSRLKAEGLVESEWVEGESGHPRKYYRLSQTGRRRVRAMAAAWSRLSHSMDRLLKPLSKVER